MAVVFYLGSVEYVFCQTNPHQGERKVSVICELP
jgi:hypothetical protein